ncbi:MAG: hypothetical protein WD668_03890, partial [Saccharospirillum sp.]
RVTTFILSIQSTSARIISAQTRTVTALNGDRVTDFKGFSGFYPSFTLNPGRGEAKPPSLIGIERYPMPRGQSFFIFCAFCHSAF